MGRVHELTSDKNLLYQYISALRNLSSIEEEMMKRAKEEFETREVMKEGVDISKNFYFSKEKTEQALKEFLHKVTEKEWTVTPHISYYLRQANNEGLREREGYLHAQFAGQIMDRYERKEIEGETYLVRKPEFWEHNT